MFHCIPACNPTILNAHSVSFISSRSDLRLPAAAHHHVVTLQHMQTAVWLVVTDGGHWSRIASDFLAWCALQLRKLDAVFIAGGHGIMFDGPESAALKQLVEMMWAAGRTVAAVCHGPAGLLSALKPSGEPLIKGVQESPQCVGCVRAGVSNPPHPPTPHPPTHIYAPCHETIRSFG